MNGMRDELRHRRVWPKCSNVFLHIFACSRIEQMVRPAMLGMVVNGMVQSVTGLREVGDLTCS